MYIDPSIIVGILLEEEDAPKLKEKLGATQRPVISVVGKIEAAVSIGRRITDLEEGREIVSAFCEDAQIETIAVPVDLYDDVLKSFGRGTGHPARLNLGDCFSYAFAKRMGGKLLYKGNDFSQTDLAGL